jgi:MFS transporter, PAT family, beta-lactamase induction signal transducer AmpG
MLPGLILTFVIKEPKVPQMKKRDLASSLLLPFQEFMHRHGLKSALTILLFIFFYKLGDSMATALATPFYLDLGFSKTEIGLIAKNAGLWPSVIGGLLGGYLDDEIRYQPRLMDLWFSADDQYFRFCMVSSYWL